MDGKLEFTEVMTKKKKTTLVGCMKYKFAVVVVRGKAAYKTTLDKSLFSCLGLFFVSINAFDARP